MHPPWCRFEAQSCGSSSAMALLTSSIPTNLSGHTNNPVKGLRTFRELYKDNTFRSFTDLSSEFELPTSHLFRYFQIRHCTKSLFPSFPSLPPNQIWDEFLCSDPLQKSLISKIYNKLLTDDSSHTTKIKAAWEAELDYNRYNSGQLDILAFTSLLARRLLLLHWKSKKAPSNAKWRSDVMSFLKLEKIKYSLRGGTSMFYTKWQPFLTFFQSLAFLSTD
ncbi:hypothetical protein F7725_006792 [Dissostichus mawsoni]|uniref:Uncharacterized protein n=1 Tax=Dissostichus mawsoni TaxID=36200 RepID=A0A7J5XUX0_DISMA|nr:hypothetical protein F7725_006792 [Dissostichus mawsoni]